MIVLVVPRVMRVVFVKWRLLADEQGNHNALDVVVLFQVPFAAQ